MYSYYHHQTVLEKLDIGMVGNLPIILLIGAFFLVFLIKSFFKISEDKRESFLQKILIFSPLWLTASIAEIIYGIKLLFSTADVNLLYAFFILILTITCFLAAFVPYAFLTLWPASFASVIVEFFGGVFSKKEVHTSFIWTLIDKVKESRRIAILGLIIVLCELTFIDLVMFFNLSYLYRNSSNLYPLIGGLVLIFVYFFTEITIYGKVAIEKGDHKRAIELKHDLENAAIATGVTPPNFQILANLNPTSFTISPNLGQPCVFVTTGLLNLASKTDLEAVCAYEVGNIITKKVFDYKLINNLLSLLKAAGYAFFILLLATLNLAWIWIILFFGLFLYVVPVISIGKTPEGSSGFEVLARLTNPPYVIVSLFAYLIYYSTSYDEVYLADLKTVQITRLPAGLYSILTKITDFIGESEQMPEKYFYLYFCGETNWGPDIPAPQPPIVNRLALLDKLDATLKHLTFAQEVKTLHCPFCASPLSEFREQSHYGITVKIDFCQKCGGAWFDKWELLNIANLKTPPQFNIPENFPVPPKFLCPKCGVELGLVGDVNVPINIHVWRCPSCQGNWLEHEHLVEYQTFKENFREKKS